MTLDEIVERGLRSPRAVENARAVAHIVDNLQQITTHAEAVAAVARELGLEVSVVRVALALAEAADARVRDERIWRHDARA